MEQTRVDIFMVTMMDKFPADKLMFIRQRLMQIDDNRYMYIQSIDYKDPTTALILSVLLGSLGVDRFYIGDVGIGLGKLFTCGGFFIWKVVDWFLIQDAAKEANFLKFMQVAV